MQKTAVLVGCGAMSKGWIEAITTNPELSESIRIVGLVDLMPETARLRAEESGLVDVKLGSDLQDMLAETKPDFLFDVVVPSARREVVATGLRNGCHVLSEKPMAASMDEAHELLALAKEAGKVHAVIQNRRFISGVRRIRQFIESGELGEITALHCDFFIGAHFGGFRDQMEHVLLLDMAIHTLDAARFMADKTPLAVYCQESNPRGSWYRHGAAANAIFEFSDDVVFTYRGSWAAEGANTSWESAWRIVGTKGTLLWDGADSFEAQTVAGSEGFFRPLAPVDVCEVDDPNQTHGHASVLIDFLAAIESGQRPETDATDNIQSLAMVFGAIKSAELGERVEISI